MIPHFGLSILHLGPISIRVWGFFAALGIILGTWYAVREARRRGLDVEAFEKVVFWVIISAFIGARLFMLVYEPWVYWSDPWEILRVWHGGFSSFGGFIGAAVAFFWLIRRVDLPVWRSADALTKALPLALGCGRIGCFLIHDHPGTLAHGAGRWLAVRYPDGPRYDLGMLLGILDFLMFGLFVWWSKKHRLADGAYLVMFLVIYAPARFLLDFLRASDMRYWGLTPAQYGCIILLGIGVYLAGNRRKLKAK